VDVGGVAVGPELRDDLLALAEGPVRARVAQFPHAGRGADVEGAAVPERAHGKGEFLGDDDTLVEDPVAVRILEPQHPVRRPLHQVLVLEVDAGGVADVEAALIVEAAHDGPFDKRRGGDPLDDEAVGDPDLRVVLEEGREQEREHHH
jgi:hypothetical protein